MDVVGLSGAQAFWDIFIAIALFAFFEPFSFDLLVAHSQLFVLLGDLCTALRFFFASLAFLYLIISEGKIIAARNSIYYVLVLYLISRVVAMAANGSLSVSAVVALYSYVGFVVMCGLLLRKSAASFLRAGVLLFGFFSLIGAVSIVVFPNGLLESDTKAEAIYALGSKNSSFFYYLFFLFFLSVSSLRERGHYPQHVFLIAVAMGGTAIICSSANTLVCLAAYIAIYVLSRYSIGDRRPLPFLIAAVVLFLGLGIYCFRDSQFVHFLLSFTSRDGFTGREDLWNQAFALIRQNFYFGIGENASFILRTGSISSHAHSFYLDQMAKYGFISTALLLVSIFIACGKVAKSYDHRMGWMCVAMLFSALMHMLLDDASLFVIVLLVLLPFEVCDGQVPPLRPSRNATKSFNEKYCYGVRDNR